MGFRVLDAQGRTKSIASILQGAPNTKGTFASRPAAGSAGALYFPTDSYMLERDNGSSWDDWGPAFNFVSPQGVSFAWFNQGGASVTNVGSGIFLRAIATAGDSIRGRDIAVPGTPYTITAAIMPIGVTASYGAGLYWSDGTKVVTLGIDIVSPGTVGTLSVFQQSATVIKWTNASTFSADYVRLGALAPGSIWWLRINDTGASRVSSISADGQNWIQIHAIGHTDFFTPTRVGFFCSSGSASIDGGVTLLSWVQS